MHHSRRTALLLAGLCLLALPACYREVSDASVAKSLPRHTGDAPWTIDGVRLGQTWAEVNQVLGEPREIRESMGQRVARWSSRDTVVVFDQAGRAVEVMGSSVKAGDQILVRAGATEAEVVQVLGPGKVQKSYRPKGSGVISLGREHTGTTLIYENHGVRFELPVAGEAAGHFLARRLP